VTGQPQPRRASIAVSSSASSAACWSLREILLAYLRAEASVAAWPGGDGLTIEYPRLLSRGRGGSRSARLARIAPPPSRAARGVTCLAGGKRSLAIRLAPVHGKTGQRAGHFQAVGLPPKRSGCQLVDGGDRYVNQEMPAFQIPPSAGVESPRCGGKILAFVPVRRNHIRIEVDRWLIHSVDHRCLARCGEGAGPSCISSPL